MSYSLLSRRPAAAFAALAFFVAACASQPRLKTGQKVEGGEVVEAEGLVPYRADDVPGTEAAALAAAQRSAVEKVVGVFVSAKTRVEKAVTVESKILANTSGYISKYDVLAKGREGDFYRVKIRALVLVKKLGDDLRELGIQEVESVGNPRVAVLIEETIDGQPADNQEGAQGLSQAFLTRGFVVLDRAAVAGAATQKALDAMEKGDVKQVADLGSQVGAEVVVAGMVQAAHLEAPGLGGMVSYRARASLQGVRAGTGQVLGTAAREASGLDAVKGVAAAKANAAAASLAGEDLAQRIAQTLKSQSQLELTLVGVTDFGRLQKFQEELRGVPGVGTVFLRSFEKGVAEISLSGATKPSNELSAYIARMKSVAVEVETYTQSRIQAALKAE